MATQYTPILQLALPVTGELNGTWGDVVNDNITSMVEQAIAGLATINTWTTNSHTLTTANGTTDEARCAMLVAATGSGGTAITGAGQIVCPALTKLYVLQNNTLFAVTLKTASGSGVAVAAGETAFLFCDGTNVNACVTTIVNGHVTGNLTVDGNATIKGNTTLGDATSDTVTVTGTVTSNLIFTDNTYDIGASGATRPRNLFLSGNATVGGNSTLGDATSDTVTVNARVASDLNPSADNTYDLGTSGNSWRNLYIDGTATIATLNVTTIDTTNLEVTNIKAKDGTAAITLADSTGVATLSANPILNAGTANGVLYLNGSKSATSGSALTFDGTTLNFGGTAQRITGDFSNATVSNSVMFQTSTANSGTSVSAIPSGTGVFSQFQAISGSDPTNASRATMRVNSSSSVVLFGSEITGTGTYFPMVFNTGGSEHMRLDTSGNLGLGVTPSAWSGLTAFQLANPASVITGGLYEGAISGANTMGMAQNAYYNGSSWQTIYTAATYYATRYEQQSGNHVWYNAPLTNGAITFTQRMLLESNGNMTVGEGSGSAYKLTVNGGSGTLTNQLTLAGTAASSISFITNANVSSYNGLTAAGDPLILGQQNQTLLVGVHDGSAIRFADTTMQFGINSSEKMRLDASGNLGIGNIPSGTYKLEVTGSVSATTYYGAWANIPSGTLMLFQQTSAPTGWTKQTTHDNKALRVVSGTAGSGGSVAFTTAFTSQAVSGSVSTSVSGSVGSTTLAESQMPYHYHYAGITFAGGGGGTGFTIGASYTGPNSNATTASGGGGSHNHSFSGSASSSFSGTAINLAVQYVDLIIASKN